MKNSARCRTCVKTPGRLCSYGLPEGSAAANPANIQQRMRAAGEAANVHEFVTAFKGARAPVSSILQHAAVLTAARDRWVRHRGGRARHSPLWRPEAARGHRACHAGNRRATAPPGAARDWHACAAPDGPAHPAVGRGHQVGDYTARRPAAAELSGALRSALDAESEHLVQEALDRLMKHRTVLVVGESEPTSLAARPSACARPASGRSAPPVHRAQRGPRPRCRRRADRGAGHAPGAARVRRGAARRRHRQTGVTRMAARAQAEWLVCQAGAAVRGRSWRERLPSDPVPRRQLQPSL
jgi:hypothetical protein